MPGRQAGDKSHLRREKKKPGKSIKERRKEKREKKARETMGGGPT
jgi:hypothetical protein